MPPEFDRLSAPDDGERIRYDEEFRSPEAPILPVAHGADGELVAATRRVLAAAADLTGREIHWLRTYVGDEARARYDDPLPRDTVRAFRRYRVGLLGPLETDRRAAADLASRFRAAVDLTTAMERRARLDWAPSPVRDGADLDVTVVRDVTEDAAAGLEYAPDADATAAFRDALLDTGADPEAVPDDPAAYGVRPFSAGATAALVETAMEYALDRDRRSLTIVHRGDGLPATEGSFLRWARETLAAEYDGATVEESAFESTYGGRYPDDEIVVRERYTDEVCRDLLTNPSEYDVLVAPASGGDSVSAVAAEAVGGVGVAPRVWLGEGRAVAATQQAPVRGTDAGDGRGGAGGPTGAGSNPTGTLLAGCHLFEELGWDDAAAVVRGAISRAFADGYLPRDLYRRSTRGTPVTAAAFADAVVDRLAVPDREPGAGGVRTSGDERAEIRRVVAGVHDVVFEDHLAPRDVELNQLLGEDEEADVYLPEVGLNFYYWRRWSAERRLEVLLHEFAHVEERPGERDHGDAFYDRFVELLAIATDWQAELEALFGEPLDFEQVYRFVVESVHEETVEPDLETVAARQQWLREQFGLDSGAHY